MTNKLAFESLDRTLQDIRQCSRLFGDILVVLCGDFRQTLPVIRGGTSANEIDACVKSSHLWQHVETHSLTTNMRAHLPGDANVAHFANHLLQVGNGRFPIVEGPYIIDIPQDLGTLATSLSSLVERVYPNLEQQHHDLDWLMERAILAPHNESTSNINSRLLTSFPGEMKIKKSIDSVKDSDAVHYPSEFPNTLEPTGMPPHRLALKIGIPIILLRNLAPGLANRTRLILKRMMTNCLEATIATGLGQPSNTPLQEEGRRYPERKNRQIPVRYRQD